MNRNKKETRTRNKALIIGIILISFILLFALISALTDNEKISLQAELDSLNNLINTDNLMLSNDNKILTL